MFINLIQYRTIIFLMMKLSFFSFISHAQTVTQSSEQLLLEKAKFRLAKNAGDSAAIDKSVKAFEILAKSKGSGSLTYHYLAYSQQYLSYFSHDDKDKQKRLIDSAIKNTKTAIKLDKDLSDNYVLLSSLYSSKIGEYKNNIDSLMKYKALYEENMAKAHSLEPDNPRYYLVKAQSLYYTPQDYGGGIAKAKPLFEKSLSLYKEANTTASVRPDWGLTDVYSWLAHIAEKQGDLNKSIDYYNKLLQSEPDYAYVRNVLLPGLLKKKEKDNNL